MNDLILKPSQLKNIPAFLAGFTIIGLIYTLKVVLDTYFTTYTITSQRVIWKFGILSRTTKFLELYRVKDVEIHQPLLLRIFRLANIEITSTDKNDKNITLLALYDADALVGELRNKIEILRSSKRRIN